MFESAFLKIDRAAKHVHEINEIVHEQRPFSYCLKTDVNTGERVTFAKKNESVIRQIALMCGDAIHNLRSALDHGYWEIVSPFTNTPREKRAVQFPFSESAARLDESIKNRLADRVSPQFFSVIQRLLPHGETGGNTLLYYIHEMDVLDKHMLLIPSADYTRVSAEVLRTQISDFPSMIGGMMTFGNNAGGDVAWYNGQYLLTQQERDHVVIPASGIIEQKLDVPVGIAIQVSASGDLRPMIPTLHQVVDVARSVLGVMQNAA